MVAYRRRKLPHQVYHLLFSGSRIQSIELLLQGSKLLYRRIGRIRHLVIRDICDSICYTACRLGLIRLIRICIHRVADQMIRTTLLHIIPPRQESSVITRVTRISPPEQVVKRLARTYTLVSRTLRSIIGSKNPVQAIP